MESERIFQEALDQPSDVTLVVENGKEFQAHRHVLSKASPFFDKLLNSDMKEANEGIVRLEMVTESSLRDILEFIYTGSVQISTEDNARELIAIADYFLLSEVKTIAGRILMRNLNVLNCISIYRFAEIYRCEELISDTKKFILANFTSVAKTEEFLDTMSIKEVEMWISSDEIDVSAEEDVFKFILTWIDRDELERKNHFSQLFRHVRLVYVSRDYLRSDIVTNDLVKDNEGCLDLVKEALRSIDSGNCDDFLVTARKSLEIPVLVGYLVWERSLQLSCYFPREDRSWCLPPALCMLPQSINQSKTLMCQMPQYIAGMPMAELRETEMRTSVTSHGKIYLTLYNPRRCCHHPEALPYLVCYDSFSNSWKLLPFKDSSKVCKMFVGSSDEIYALVSSDNLGDECRPCKLKLNYLRKRYNGESHSVLLPWGADCPGHMYTVTKYKPKSNSCENIISFKGPLKYLLRPLLGKNQFAVTQRTYACIGPNLDNRY